MSFTVVNIGKNPKRKKTRAKKVRTKTIRKRKITRVKKNPEALASKEYQEGYSAARAGVAYGKSPYNFLTGKGRRWNSGWEAGIGRRTAMRRNPVRKTKSLQSVIIGYSVKYKKGRASERKGKRYYYVGGGFSRTAENVKKFPGDGAKLEAKRIVSKLPLAISYITVERI